jgi:hypothetical protein
VKLICFTVQQKVFKMSPGVEETAEGAKLKRVFGVFDAAAHIVGGIIGSGIFVSPKVNLKN